MPHFATVFRRWRWPLLVVAAALFLGCWALCWWWSREPEVFYVNEKTPDGRTVVGYSTVDTLTHVISWLLDKPGGYLSNDIAPPSAWLDNMPSFEFGVVVQCRDLARVLRQDYSRSQSQSVEDKDLIVAEPDLNYTNDRWLVPSTEGKYREALDALNRYKARLIDADPNDAQFYARADNLREWLLVVETRLGSLSQRLSASVGQIRVNTDLGGAPAGESARTLTKDVVVQDAVVRDRRRVLRITRQRVGDAALPARRTIRLRAHARGQERGGEPAADHPRARGRARAGGQPDHHERQRVRVVSESLARARVVFVTGAFGGGGFAGAVGAGLGRPRTVFAIAFLGRPTAVRNRQHGALSRVVTHYLVPQALSH